MRLRRALLAVVAVPVLGIAMLLLNAVVLPTADAPGDAPPRLQSGARHACQPFGRVASLSAPDGPSGDYTVRCTWSPIGWPSFTVNVSCSDGEWTGPQGWNEWGPYGVPCVATPPSTAAVMPSRQRPSVWLWVVLVAFVAAPSWWFVGRKTSSLWTAVRS